MVPILIYGKDNADRVFRRTQLGDPQKAAAVAAIVADVRERGDEALFGYARKFDGAQIDASCVEVSEAEIDEAYAQVDPALVESLRRSAKNVFDYHSRQRAKFADDNHKVGKSSTLGWRYRALRRVGLYVPGGKASYPSTVLMTAIPAVAAGVEELIVCTPNLANPLIAVACRECGVKKIYRVGGAQAIAAMAYGTESIPRVDLIAGPGNVFVTLAKKQVFGDVAIDMIAGPSEVLVIADDSANAEWVAADLLSQAEHDESAASILVTDSERFGRKVAECIEEQTARLPRRAIIEKSLASNGAIVVCKDMKEAIEVADRVAPEHLEVCTRNAREVAAGLSNAGALFVGNWSPEPLGDYYAGPSHVLPTSGSARFSSVLSVDTFMKKTSYIEYSGEDLLAAADDVTALADSEGFGAHANSIRIRRDK